MFCKHLTIWGVVTILAGCSSDIRKGLPEGGIFGTAKSSNAEEKEQQAAVPRVVKVLQQHCESCHGPAETAQGGISLITDLNHLVTENMVLPGRPDQSLLLAPVLSGDMPPAGSMPQDDIAVIHNWILSLAGDEDDVSTRELIPDWQANEVATKDLLTFPKEERSQYRYLSLTQMYNAKRPRSVIRDTKSAIDKALNSLSTKTELVSSVYVDEQQLIVRYKISDYGWDPKNYEDLVLKYPYQLITDQETSLAVMQADTGSIAPIVRADWFVATATKAPFYYRFLKLPRNLQGLGDHLKIDIYKNIDEKKVIRAGFDDSAIADHNRILERHDTPTGFLWRSYEFANNAGKNDIFNRPLGPPDPNAVAAGDDVNPINNPLINAGGTVITTAGVETDKFFTEDGGEFIFQLPNGLPAYFVVGRDHNRISQPPAVRSPTGVAQVFVGRTCMNCHKTGLIMHKDQMRDRTLEVEMSPEERQLVNALYPTNEKLMAQYLADNEMIQKATRLLKLNEDRPEPVTSLSRVYDEIVDFEIMALELGITLEQWETVFVDPNDPDQLTKDTQVINNNPNILIGGIANVSNPFLGNLPETLADLDRTFSSQVRNGRVTRESFEANFSVLAKHFHGGTP